MLLVIDAGNTNIVFAVHDGAEWRGTWRIATDPQRTSDEYAVWLMALLGFSGLKRTDVHAADIGTVVPAALYHLRRLCRDWFEAEPLIARSNLDWGFDIRVDNPAEVGADRLLNSLAALQTYGGPLIIIDLGTATTFDVVAGDGAYVGGVIAPGVNLSLEALHMAAAALPHVDVTRPQRVIGTNTVACMQSGVFWGYVGLVREICDRIKGERDRPMNIIGTGGLAPLFGQGLALFDRVEDDLTMHGLTVIHDFNKETA